jgi:hypothetical protein
MHTRETTRQVQQTMNARTVGWIVGSSIGFEAFVLALAAFIFSRRDF